jgi:hypothetical protein
VKLSIPDVPPSLNKTTRQNGFANWRLKNKWVLFVRSQLNGSYLKPVVRMRCMVTLHHSRMYDKDNAYGACKPLIDALKHWKLIFDDTAEYLELSVEQSKCPHKQRHTEIELEAV